MEASVSVINKVGDDQQMDLPPGFRFHPTDEELITHYLSHKVLDTNFNARAIGEVDLNKCEPWDLPWRAKLGEKEWYFFCVRDRKYPTGLRTNRATEAGYWKATGKDKEIYRGGKTLVGMKKTLVFYKGRAPKGEKTNWVMHEYRLEGKLSLYNLPKTSKNEWVICRVFQKTSGGKKTIVTGLGRYGGGEELGTSYLPPLMDSSPFNERNNNRFHDAILNHVTCFSNSMAEAAQKNHDDNDNDGIIQYSSTPNLSVNPSMVFSKNPFYDPSTQNLSNFQYPVSSGLVHQDHQSNILRALLETHHHGSSIKQQQQQNFKAERDQMISMSQETGLSTSTADNMNNNTNHEISSNHHGPSSTSAAAAGPVDLDCLFYY